MTRPQPLDMAGPDPDPEPPRSGMVLVWIAAALVAWLVIGALVWWFLS